MASEDAGTPATGQAAAQAAAGWYADPWFKGQRRFWDGTSWTAHAFPENPGPGGAPGSLSPAPPPTVGVPGGGPPPPDWWAPAAKTEPEAFPLPGPPPDGAQARPWWPPRGRTLVALLIILGFLAGLVGGALLPGNGSSNSNSNALQQPAFTPTIPGFSPRAPAPSDPSASVLSGIVLQQSDVGPTETVAPISGGTQVSGGATLDLCNGTFPSESLRTARLQVAGADDQGAIVLSTEAVLYSTPAAAAQALAELKSTAASCPASPVVSPVGEPTVATTLSAAPDGAWPQVATVERLAFDFVTTDALGQSQHYTTAYLRRGRALMGVYFSHPDGPQPAVNGQTTMAGIVNVFATRMANLPASAVGG